MPGKRGWTSMTLSKKIIKKPALEELQKTVFPLCFQQLDRLRAGAGNRLLYEADQRENHRRRISHRRLRSIHHRLPQAISQTQPANTLLRQFGVYATLRLRCLDRSRLLHVDVHRDKPHLFRAYIKEFSRVLKPRGYAVFDYFDVAAEEGWNNLMENMARPRPIFNYNYHATDTIDKLVALAGLEVLERVPTIRGSTFVIARKIAK